MKTVRQLLAMKNGGLRTIASATHVIEALKLMATHDIGALLVVDEGKLVGILSERDYARKVALLGKSSSDVTVAEIMTAKVTSVRPEQTVDECMQLMTDGRFRHLPVLDHGRLTGILSIGDLVKEVIADQAEVIQHLETYIQT
ncbi:MAG TPA: CBS domain-containing protein [Rhodocyclaceae bacterium]|nr:CBS domain-containing protein [Rhodocyclaceae bacterium]